jgi:hypothetical protein
MQDGGESVAHERMQERGGAGVARQNARRCRGASHTKERMTRWAGGGEGERKGHCTLLIILYKECNTGEKGVAQERSSGTYDREGAEGVAQGANSCMHCCNAAQPECNRIYHVLEFV